MDFIDAVARTGYLPDKQLEDRLYLSSRTIKNRWKTLFERLRLSGRLPGLDAQPDDPGQRLGRAVLWAVFMGDQPRVLLETYRRTTHHGVTSRPVAVTAHPPALAGQTMR